MKSFKFNDENIISLWQNPYYKDVLFNIYKIVNNFLRTGEIKINQSKLNKLDIKIDFFEEFLIKYINKITNILYKDEQDNIIVYRGENRETFEINSNDILLYKNFHSTSNNISLAYNFSLSKTKPNNKRLILVLKIPKGFYYKKLDKPVKYINDKDQIIEYHDEFEYLVPPNSYYQVTKVINLTERVILIKAVMIRQEKYIFSSIKDKYIEKAPVIRKVKDFTDKNSEEFIEEFYNYYRSLSILNKLDKYQIRHKIFSLIKKSYQNLIFTHDVNNLGELIELFENDFNEDTDILNKSITNVRNIPQEIFSISKIKVYAGIYNINWKFNTPKIIKMFDENKTGIYNQIIVAKIIPDCFYYDCVVNNMYPTTSLEKDRHKELVYTKYILELELNNVKILVSKEPEFYYETSILLLPFFKYELTQVVKTKNKFNLPLSIYKIKLLGV